MKSDIQLYPDLIKALEKNEIVYLFGAGFSTALSGRKYTWWDWIVDGIGRIKDHATADMLNESLMSDNSTDNMVSVVGKVIKILKEEGSYKTWMHEAFESTVVVNEKLKNTLMKILLMQDVFATTNYDHLLENATGLMTVSYEEPNVAFQMLKQGKSNNVLHIHGIYDSEKEIDNIVADKEQYDAVMNNQGAQFIQGILGTRTLIFVGCGKTTEDANISRFIQFANSHLKMNQEYYFLYREGENPVGMPSNIKLISYGNEYSDLPDFLEDMAELRIKEKVIKRPLIGLSPYKTAGYATDVLQKYHYSLQQLPFCGRTSEMSQLQNFLEEDQKFLWWAITGQAGAGKSRLALEFLKQSAGKWFGFFVNENATQSDFDSFEPFNNTVVVIDYVASREGFVANAIRSIKEKFENSDYKIRILLLERENSRNASSWYYKLLQRIGKYDTYDLKSTEYKNYFLNLGDLDRASVETLIKEVMNQRGIEADDIVARELCEAYGKKYEKLQFRPLFVQIFVEAWIENDFQLPRYDKFEELLQKLLEREQQRWLEILDNDQSCCNAFIHLLLRANISGKLQPEKIPIYYQDDWNMVNSFLQNHSFPGKQREEEKKAIFATICQNVNENSLEIEPLYPDLIKEYMFCFYMDDSRLSEVLNELWQNEASKFAIFITRALTDFPEISFFKKVLKEFDENTQNIDVLLGRLNLLQKRTVDENDDPMVLISIIDNEYAFWRQVKIPEENTQKEKLATTKVMGLNMVAQQYAGWSLYDLSYMMEALDEMCKVQGGEATNVLKQLFLSEAIKGLSQKGFVEESNSLIQKMNEIIGENPEMDELSSISEMDCYNAEMMNDLQLEKFDDALNVLKTMRSKCNYENINAVRILMLSHRNIIEMAFQMGKKDVIAKVMADAKMLSEKYLNDVDVQAKWMLCRLCDLEERFFDKGETISLDEVSEIKIEAPLNSYEKNNEESEYLGMLWGATNTFKLNFVNKDKDKINTIITDAREILSVNPYQCEVAGAFMSAQLALCKGILHRKIVRTEIDEVFRYVELNPYSESLRELFFNKLLPNSTEEKNRAHYLTKAVVINAQQDARYNPMSDGGVQEIADFEEGLREFLFGENKYQEPYKRVRPKVGANELCPCGSGKKFKKCCRGNGKYD